MPGTHCYVPQCINRGNSHVINDQLQAKNTSAGRVPLYVITAESKCFLSDTLAVRLLGSSFTFASSGCLIYKFTSKLRVTMHVVVNRCAADWWQILHGSSLRDIRIMFECSIHYHQPKLHINPATHQTSSAYSA